MPLTRQDFLESPGRGVLAKSARTPRYLLWPLSRRSALLSQRSAILFGASLFAQGIQKVIHRQISKEIPAFFRVVPVSVGRQRLVNRVQPFYGMLHIRVNTNRVERD